MKTPTTLKSLAMLGSLALLSGCASTQNGTSSYVSPQISAGDANLVAQVASDEMVHLLPPAHTTLVIDPKDGDTTTARFIQLLRNKGYAVSQMAPTGLTHEQKRDDTFLQLIADPLNGGIYVVVYYDNNHAATWLGRDKYGHLVTTHATFTVQTVDVPNGE